MPRFYLLCFITFAFQVTGGIKLDFDSTDTGFTMTCTDIGSLWTVYWFRDEDLVLKSHFWGSLDFTEEDFEERTELHTSTKTHRITITSDENDNATYWYCCRWKYFKYVCSNSLCELGPCTDNETVAPPIMPTDDPDEAIHFNATLKLTSHPGIISESQQMTLTCAISNEIDEDKWFVLWIRNDTPVFITGNSSLSSAENLTDEFAFPHDGDANEDILHSLFSNINVTSDAIQQKVVIPVSSPLIGSSLWNCANPYLADLSNTLILEVMAKTTPTIEGYTTSDHRSIDTKTTPSTGLGHRATEGYTTSDHRSIDTKTTPSSTGLGHRDNKTSSTTYIIAGSVGGVVGLVLIVVMVMVVLRMRRRNEKRSADAVYESTKEDIVMEDNVLYEGSKDNTRQNSDYLDDDLVIEDNVLYVSDNGAVSQEKGRKIPSEYE